MAKVATKTGETVRTRGMLYKSVVHMVLLHGSNIWVMMGDMFKVLEELHHWETRRISGMMDRRTTGGEWECLPLDDAVETAGLCPIKEYIHRSQATIVALVACRTIYEL